MDESCALCEKKAMMLCNSDQAKLCWDCDEKVHSANFLVAKHLRVLLCRLCHSPTPWKASGTKLTPTVSFCHRCVVSRHATLQQLVNDGQQRCDCVEDDGDHGSDYVFDDDDDNSDNADDSGGEEKDEEDEERENQEVPMSSGSATLPPRDAGLALKRLRNNTFSVNSHDEIACASFDMLSDDTLASSSDESTTSMSVLKRHRIDQRNY